MENIFINAMTANANLTTTENGAKAYKSTNNAMLDLFGTIGALRQRDTAEVINLFSRAFEEDELAATKLTFYARDIRGGLGERTTPRTIWKWLANNYPEVVRKNAHLIPKYGRWDDLYELFDTPCEALAIEGFYTQIVGDLKAKKDGQPISLCAKWLKSTNCSNKEARELGKKTAKAFGWSEKKYRKVLSELRRYGNVVEVDMSAKNYDNINYEAVPSRAMKQYRAAFRRNDEDRFEKYIEAVSKGEAKINTGAIYPYDIVAGYKSQNAWFRDNCTIDAVLEEQWNNLPNYVEGENNILVMADTSGSMWGHPINVSESLAIYFAERNHGAFHNKFMTFSDKPQFVTLRGKSLAERLNNIEEIVANTNLEAAMDLILEVAVENEVPAEDMPKALVIISDMEFDQATSPTWGHGYQPYEASYHELIMNKFAEAGYEMPKIVFWNANSRHDVFHAKDDMENVLLVSGASPSTFKIVLANLDGDATQLMEDVLAKYEDVTI